MNEKNFKPRSPEQNKPRNMFVRNEFFLQIESGYKTCELRLANESFLRIKPKRILEFKTSKENRGIKAIVTGTRRYPSFESLAEKEDLNKIAPGISPEQAKEIFKQLFNETDVKDIGLVVIEFKKI